MHRGEYNIYEMVLTCSEGSYQNKYLLKITQTAILLMDCSSSPQILKSQLLIGIFYRTWSMIRNTNDQDCSDDVFERRRAPSPLTPVKIIEY